MTPARLALFSLLLALAFLVLAHEASAASTASGRTCSDVRVDNSGNIGQSTWRIAWDSLDLTGSTQCPVPAGSALIPNVVDSGGSITLKCTRVDTGNIPPGVPNTLTIRGFWDTDQFPGGTTSPIWTWTPADPSCAGGVSNTFFCTTDGTSGGTKKAGPVRIVVNPVRTSLPGTYNENSDQGTQDSGHYGVYLCAATATAVNDTSSGGPRHIYKGGDSLIESITTGETGSGNSGAVFAFREKCAPALGVVDAAVSWTTTGPSATHSIVTSNFAEGCTLVANISITRSVGLTGWTSLAYTTWNGSSRVPSGATVANGTQQTSATGLPIYRDFEKSTGNIVSFLGSFDHLVIAKTSGGANASIFTIGNDPMYLTAFGLKDPSGAVASGIAVTCTQYTPANAVDATLAMGNTDASGNTAEKLDASTNPPAAMFWKWSCTASWSGNTAQYDIFITHASPLTSSTGGALIFNYTTNATDPTKYDFNISLVIRVYDPSTDNAGLAIPDGDVKLTLQCYNATLDRFVDAPVNRSLMVRNDGGMSSSYHYNVTLNATNVSKMVAYAFFNLTGNPYLIGEGFALPNMSAAASLPANATFTNLNATNATFTHLSFGDILGTVTLSTAFDPYIPLLIWGALVLLFAWLRAILPMVASLLALADSILPTPVMNLGARVMLFLLALFIHFVWKLVADWMNDLRDKRAAGR